MHNKSDYVEFVRLVVRMREMQNKYWLRREQVCLQQAKALEGRVDKMAKVLLAEDQAEQMSLAAWVKSSDSDRLSPDDERLIDLAEGG